MPKNVTGEIEGQSKGEKMIQESILRGDLCSTVTQYAKNSSIRHYLYVAGHFIHFHDAVERDEIFKAIEEHGCGASSATGCLTWGDRALNKEK